jgi:hypothetical protein
LTRFSAAALLVLTVGGCGTPAHLDAQEQVAFARACASLIERNLSDNKPPRTGRLGSEDVNLDEPSSFYSILGRIRGPDTFNLHDPKHDADTARQPLDDCNTKPVLGPSLFSSSTSATATTTTSIATTSPSTTPTVPGS